MGPSAPMGEPNANHTGRRIVFTTIGSLGDVYPYIALAEELQARGHTAVIATTRYHREQIEARGIGFHAIRPDIADLDAPEVMRRAMDARKGSEYVIRELVMPVLRETYEDLLAATRWADLLVSHVLTFAARLVAEKTGIAWASTFLQPLGLFSAYDPPVLPQMPWLAKLRFLGPAFHRSLFRLGKWSCRSWGAPWYELRAALGLPPTSDHPVLEGDHAATLVLALFSSLFAARQPDWPAQTVVTGFPFLDESGGAELSPELVRFLDSGPPPVVFTLGSSGTDSAGPFYEHSIAAAGLLGRRSILILGNDYANRPASLPDGIVAFDYAPFRKLFPRAAAVVHAGGIGTTALAMRAGRPMLVMPCAHDQFDNAARATRLGIARTIPQHRYLPAQAAAELGQLLNNPLYAERASSVGERIGREDGVRSACDALEGLLAASSRRVGTAHRTPPTGPVGSAHPT